jgi:hypothetical protein
MAAAVPPAAPDGVSIQLRTAALAELLADRLRAAEFAADVDAAAREVRVALPGRASCTRSSRRSPTRTTDRRGSASTGGATSSSRARRSALSGVV